MIWNKKTYHRLDIRLPTMPSDIHSSTQHKDNQTNTKKKTLKEFPLHQPVFFKKPLRPVIDKSVLAAFLGQPKEEKKEIIEDEQGNSEQLWTSCEYCEVYLKVSNLEKHLRKCCGKWGMIIKK